MTPNGSASAATPNGLVTLWLPLVFELVAADVHRTSALNGSSPFLQYLQKEKALPFRPPQIVRTAQKEALCKIIKF